MILEFKDFIVYRGVSHVEYNTMRGKNSYYSEDTLKVLQEFKEMVIKSNMGNQEKREIGVDLQRSYRLNNALKKRIDSREP